MNLAGWAHMRSLCRLFGRCGSPVERVKGRKLYQATLTNHYKQAFVLAQKVKVGEDFNPFFKFYEGTLTYPVTDRMAPRSSYRNDCDELPNLGREGS